MNVFGAKFRTVEVSLIGFVCARAAFRQGSLPTTFAAKASSSELPERCTRRSETSSPWLVEGKETRERAENLLLSRIAPRPVFFCKRPPRIYKQTSFSPKDAFRVVAGKEKIWETVAARCWVAPTSISARHQPQSLFTNPSRRRHGSLLFMVRQRPLSGQPWRSGRFFSLCMTFT